MADNKIPMTPEAARRIQGHSDKTGTNEGFKERAQRSAEKNTGADAGGKGGGENKSSGQKK